MSLKDRRLWKRIWWSLFTEDKHAAVALGQPVHIRLSVCDVEPLEESDFEDQSDTEPLPFGVHQNVHTSYVISLSKLSRIDEFIIEKSFNV